jgi:hypothetical protein
MRSFDAVGVTVSPSSSSVTREPARLLRDPGLPQPVGAHEIY